MGSLKSDRVNGSLLLKLSITFQLCKVSYQQWKEIQREFYCYLALPNLDSKIAHFGILYDQDQQQVKNHIILTFMKFLYENKGCPNKVNVHAFKRCLKRFIQIEYSFEKRPIL